uniref:Reverse transcriptase domain-containing protein n=1 Tax=Ditylenchus dipsaci TaxID=166011 RepID=A0A915D6Y2_9BILA
MRIVHNASSKAHNSFNSLNDCLETGPTFFADLVATLIKFRLPAQVASADIEKAFYQVRVNEEDRNALSFLWVFDPENRPLVRISAFSDLEASCLESAVDRFS